MAPERKHLQSVNGQKASRYRKVRRTTSEVGAANTSTAASSYDTSLQHPSHTHTHKSTPQYTSANNQPQKNAQGTYLYFSRPWGQDDSSTNNTAANSDASPLDRWQNEGIRDQPWHGMEGVYVNRQGNMSADKQDNSVQDGAQGSLDGKTQGGA